MAPKVRKRVGTGKSGRRAAKPGGKGGIRRRKRRSRAASPKHGLDLARVEKLILRYTNTERALNLGRSLTHLPALSTAARGHARWMARVGRSSHKGKGGSTFVSRIKAADRKLENCGPSENVGQVLLMITSNCTYFFTKGKTSTATGI